MKILFNSIIGISSIVVGVTAFSLHRKYLNSKTNFKLGNVGIPKLEYNYEKYENNDEDPGGEWRSTVEDEWIHNVIWEGYKIEDVPEKFRTPGVIRSFLQSRQFNNKFDDLPEKYQEEVLNNLTNKKSMYYLALDKIPEDKLTQDMCDYCVKNLWHHCYFLLPNKFKTKELTNYYVNTCYNYCYSLKHIPNEFLTEEICWNCVSRNSCELANVPEKFLTKKLLKAALINNSNSLQYVPYNFLKEVF